ncbi:hypothetical protein GQ473_01890 [archaeon]|nr:hypothetical protein [archaeon]
MNKQYGAAGRKERFYLFVALAMFFSFGFVSNVFAVELTNVSISPSTIWINQLTGESDIKLFADCVSNSTANVTALITGASTISVDMMRKNNTSIYTGTYVISSFGGYNATVTCGNVNETDTTIVPFYANLLDVNVISISETAAYAGNISVVRVEVLLNGAPLTDGADFSVLLKDSFNTLNVDVREISIDDGVYELVWDIPAVEPGDYDVYLVVLFDGNSFTMQFAAPIKIRPPVELEILKPSVDMIYSLTDTKEVEIVVRTKYNLFLIDTLHQSDFCVELDDKELQIDNFTFDSVTDTYSFFVDLYRIDPEKYDYELFACVNPDGFPKYKSDFFVPVEFMVDFEGVLQDAKKNHLSGVTIILVKTSGGATYDECVTDSSGFCSVTIHPGIYDIEMVFSDISVKLYDVLLPGKGNSFNRIQDIVRYDRSTNTQIDGLKKIRNFVAVDFMLPYDGAKVIMSDAGDGDFQVFMCSEWNFADRVCLGIWEPFDFGINYFANKIEFETDELFAFVTGDRDSLKVEMDEYQEKYFVGEEVSLKGIVKDSNGNAVADASITYRFGDIEGSTLSEVDGSFRIKANVPEIKGVFDVLLNVEKSPYISTKSTMVFETYKKESIDLSVPQSLSVSLDNEKSIAARIKNTGQTTILDVKLIVSDLSSSWYKITPHNIDILKPGDEKEVTITFFVSLDDCANISCKQEYDLQISAQSGGGVKATDGFVMYLEGAFDSVDEQKTAEIKAGFSENIVSGIVSVENSLTGLAFGAELPGSYLIILFLVVIFVIMKLLKIPKKQNLNEIHRMFDEVLADEIKAEVLRGAKELNISANRKKSEVGKNRKIAKKMSDSNAKKDIRNILANPFD